MWVFGYGSLIWKVDFPYKRKSVGYIQGYIRRFWQASEDHRGTPEAPGRVLTLIPMEQWEIQFKSLDETPGVENGVCWGVVYEIGPEDVEDVKKHLDHREKGGYEALSLQVHLKDPIDGQESVQAMVYFGSTENPMFVGPSKDLAHKIAHSVGPSGKNSDYLLELCKAHRQIAPENDHHLDWLEGLVKVLI
ncbi:Chac2 protein-like protein [Gorgonomyces haynaldii]|nr:Chac2 protein-like protein [Gorgonomyces haynaldii]